MRCYQFDILHTFIEYNSISISLHYFNDILVFHLVWVSYECVNRAHSWACRGALIEWHSRANIKTLTRRRRKNWMNNFKIYAEHTYIFMRAYSYEGNEHFWWNPISLLRPPCTHPKLQTVAVAATHREKKPTSPMLVVNVVCLLRAPAFQLSLSLTVCMSLNGFLLRPKSRPANARQREHKSKIYQVDWRILYYREKAALKHTHSFIKT